MAAASSSTTEGQSHDLWERLEGEIERSGLLDVALSFFLEQLPIFRESMGPELLAATSLDGYEQPLSWHQAFASERRGCEVCREVWGEV